MSRFVVIAFFVCNIGLLLSDDCYSQEKFRALKGVITDAATGLELTAITVSLRNTASGLVTKVISEADGSFHINKIRGDRFILEITSIGYKDTALKVLFNNESFINLGKLKIASLVKPLQPVNVYGQKPLIEQTADNITYNVDADPENTYLNAFEVLRKVPLITTDADDNIRLNGNSDFKILVNGKPSLIFSRNLQNVLQSLQAGSIQSIEVTTNPRARYQSEGAGGIININTFRSIVGGLNGGANVRAIQLNGVQASGDFTAGSKMFSTSISASYLKRSLPLSNSTIVRNDNLNDQTLTQLNIDKRTSSSLNNALEITFQPDKQNFFTAAVMRNGGTNDNRRMQNSILYDETAATNTLYRALNNFDSRITTTDYAADFTHTFKNNEARVFDVSYKLSRSNASNKIAFAREPSYNNESSHGESSYSDQQDDYYLQVNYAQPFKQHLIEIGISDTRRVTNSESSPINSVFDFGEKVKAAYASFKLKFNRWLVTNEGRWEKADTRFTLSSGESQHNTYSYFIPNISISRTVIKNSVIRFGYSQRVTRPDISYLDPFVNNVDAFNLSYGNPFLKPTLSHAVNLTFTTTIRKLFFSVNASHQFTHNTIEQITRVGVDTISRTTYENTGLYSSSAAGVSVSGLLLKKITINMNSAINYVRFGDPSLSKTGIHSGITYNTGITTTTHFKRWTIAAYASYVSPLLSAQGTSSTFITNSFTISKRFLDKKNLTLALSVFEPFVGKRISVMEFGDPQFSVMQRLTTVTRQVNMSLNYRFARIKAE